MWFLVHRKWNSFDTKSFIFYPWVPFRDKNNNNDNASDNDDDDDDDDDDDADADYGDNKIENDNEEGGGNPRWSKHGLIQEETCNYIILYDKLNYTRIFWLVLTYDLLEDRYIESVKIISILDSMLPYACTVIDH